MDHTSYENFRFNYHFTGNIENQSNLEWGYCLGKKKWLRCNIKKGIEGRVTDFKKI